MVINNLIKFPVSQKFANYWGQSTIASMIENNYLNLIVRRDDYTEVTEGAGVKGKRGYVQIFGDKEYKRIGFRVKVQSHSEDLYLALRELAEFTAGTSARLNPIEAIDYCHFHDRTDRDRGYRVRRGIFEGNFSQVKGTITQGYQTCNGNQIITGNRYSAGFSFKFMEVEYQYYF